MSDTSTPTRRIETDVFDKAREHDRTEQLELAREHDMLPYFRLLTSQAGPVVEMEGRETIMLGSNNYLGLTGDERVKAAARQALERYGTGLTGSRLLNGTTPLHLQLEEELARPERIEMIKAEDARRRIQEAKRKKPKTLAGIFDADTEDPDEGSGCLVCHL